METKLHRLFAGNFNIKKGYQMVAFFYEFITKRKPSP